MDTETLYTTPDKNSFDVKKYKWNNAQYELCEKQKNSFVGKDPAIRNQRHFSQNLMKH